jgi:hypothetical protein
VRYLWLATHRLLFGVVPLRNLHPACAMLAFDTPGLEQVRVRIVLMPCALCRGDDVRTRDSKCCPPSHPFCTHFCRVLCAGGPSSSCRRTCHGPCFGLQSQGWGRSR